MEMGTGTTRMGMVASLNSLKSVFFPLCSSGKKEELGEAKRDSAWRPSGGGAFAVFSARLGLRWYSRMGQA
jgi:hypothetical protein